MEVLITEITGSRCPIEPQVIERLKVYICSTCSKCETTDPINNTLSWSLGKFFCLSCKVWCLHPKLKKRLGAQEPIAPILRGPCSFASSNEFPFLCLGTFTLCWLWAPRGSVSQSVTRQSLAMHTTLNFQWYANVSLKKEYMYFEYVVIGVPMVLNVSA